MDYTNSRAVPFEISDINHGLQVAKGLLKADKDGIELEFEIRDAILGIINSGVKTVRISYGDLESIRFEKGWFRAKIILEATSMRVFEEIPGTEQGTCTLKVKRGDREEAQTVISKARVALSEHKLNELDGKGEQ